MKTLKEMQEVLNRVSYDGWTFRLAQDGDRPYLQIEAFDRCNVTGEEIQWKGRKWFLSPHMTDSEIVTTALKAVLTALEHEAREKFQYRGVTIFDPHIHVEALLQVRLGFAHGGLDERHHIEREAA